MDFKSDSEYWEKLSEDYKYLLYYASKEGCDFYQFIDQLNKILEHQNQSKITAPYNGWYGLRNKVFEIDPELAELIGPMWTLSHSLTNYLQTKEFQEKYENKFRGKLTKACRV